MKLIAPEVGSDLPFDGNQSTPNDRPSPMKGRRLIKVDFSVICDDDDDLEDDFMDKDPAEKGDSQEDSMDTPKTRPNPWHRTGTLSNTGPLTREEYHHYCDTALECTLPPQKACRVASCQIL